MHIPQIPAVLSRVVQRRCWPDSDATARANGGSCPILWRSIARSMQFRVKTALSVAETGLPEPLNRFHICSDRLDLRPYNV
jgi:hypothetical protein